MNTRNRAWRRKKNFAKVESMQCKVSEYKNGEGYYEND